MLKKYTSNKIISLTDNNDINKTHHIDIQTQKNMNKIKNKNRDDRNDSQKKNSILIKDILKSNSLIQNSNKENILINYKNRISLKNEVNHSKIQEQKNRIQYKTKIKTTFSNYYTDYIFKNNINNNRQKVNNFTEITYKGDDIDEVNELNKEKTLKNNKLKYARLYNTDSSYKIDFNTGLNINNKDFSPNKKGSVISPKNKQKHNNEKKNENLNTSILKMPNIRKRKIENSKNLIYINNLSESNNLSNDNNLSKSNKNMKKYKEVYKKNKNEIKKKETNNLIHNNNINKLSDKNMERNKDNKISEYEKQGNNKTSNKINIHNARKHIFLSPLIKNNNNLEKNKSSSKKNRKKNDNNLNQFKAINSTTNKEIKNIIFKFKENQNKIKTKKVNKISKNALNIINNNEIKNNKNKEKQTLQDEFNRLPLKKDNSSTIKSEDNNTEKEFNLEIYKISEKNSKTKRKNLKDYFKMARKVLKNASHSLVESISTSNNFYDDDFRYKINELGQITNRDEYSNNKEKEDDDDTNNYTIKKVPIFKGINMFPQKDIKDNKDNNTLYKIFIKNDKDIIKYIINYLDIKSKIILSSINKDFFKNLRFIFYKIIFNAIYKNKNVKFIKKLNHSLIKSESPKNKESIYEKMSTTTPYLDIILSDIDRTFPKDSKFQKDGKNYKRLYNILTKYSNYNKDIGYAQGLNFMFANALLLFDNEKDAFFFVDAMIKKFKLKKFFAEKNSKLIEEIKKFSKILEKYNPEIVNFFEKKFIYHEFFSTGWILTLFSNSMESKNLFICWNFMNIFGWKFFYSLVIQILRFYKQIIFHTNENGLSLLMKNLLKEKKFTDDLPNILNKTFNFMQNHITL